MLSLESVAEALGSMTIHTGNPATKSNVKMSLGQCAKAMELFEQAMQGGATRRSDPYYRRDAIGRVIVEDGLPRMDQSTARTRTCAGRGGRRCNGWCVRRGLSRVCSSSFVDSFETGTVVI
jgi:hypothetical protein